MRKVLLASVVAVALAGDLVAVHIGKTDFNGYPVVVPAVKKLVPTDGMFALPSQLGVTPMPGVDLTFLQRIYAAEVKGGCVRETAESPHVRLALDETASPKSKEGYFLRIESTGIEIRARTSAGLFYGLQTLGWMIRNRTGDALKCCTVDDWPDMKFRGVMFDCNMTDVAPRHVSRLCEVMDGLAALKCNVAYCDFAEDLPLSISNEFNRKETLTKDDVARLREAASRNHISIVPNLQCISHSFWMSRHRDWSALSEGKERIPWVRGYCPRNPEAKRIVETVIRETCDLFRPKLFMLNLDELTHSPYGQCPLCRGKDCAQAVIDHVKPIEKMLLDRGIRPMVAHDEFVRHDAFKPDSPFARCLDAFDEKTVVVVWLYDRSPSILPYLQFQEKGRDLLFMSWMNFLPNTMTLPRVAAAAGVPGGVVSYWGWMNATFDGLDTMPSRALAGTVGHASCCWNLKSPDFTCPPYDPTVIYKQALARDRIVRFETAAKPVALDGSFTAKIGGTDRRYPAFDAATLEELARDLASDAEGYRLVRDVSAERVKAIVLAGSEKDDAVLPRSVRIPIGVRTEGLSFLMAAAPRNAWVKRANSSPGVARLTMAYEDGAKVECPLAYDRDIVQWNECFGPRTGRIVARVNDKEGAVVNLSEFPWRNPKPDVALREIVFSSALYEDIAPMIFAVSTHGPSVASTDVLSEPPDVSEGVRAAFAPIHDFAKQGMEGIDITDKTYTNGAPLVSRIMNDARRGAVLEIVGPPPKDAINRRVLVDVAVPPELEVTSGTYGMDMFCDHPEEIARADMYLVGTPGFNARIFFDRGYGFPVGWTRVNMPVSAFDEKEEGGVSPGTVRAFRFGFFLGNSRPVTFRFGNLDFARETVCGRFDIKDLSENAFPINHKHGKVVKEQ